MFNRLLKIVTVLVIAVTCCSGCLWAPNLEKIKNEIITQIPGAEFDKEVSLTLGPLALGMARIVTGFIPDAKEARSYIKEIRKLELAVYETEHLPSLDNLRLPAKLDQMRNKENWQVLAKVRERDQFVWVMYQEKKEQIESLFVLVLDDDNLVLAKIKGNFEKLALQSIKDSNILKEG